MALSKSDKRPYPPPTDDYKGKLCVISVSCDENSLYILDFNSADDDADAEAFTEFIDLPPALRFMGQLNFCVLDSQVYVIGADDGGIYSDPPKKLWMCKYDLDSPSLPPPNSLIDLTMLKRFRVSDMKASKWIPEVVPTPNGMILVYSKHIAYVSSSEGIDAECADFEVYNPKLNQWEKLPQLHLWPSWNNVELHLLDNSGNWTTLPGCDRGLMKIRKWNRNFALTTGGFFINGSSTFLLTLEIGAMFTLNFDSLEKGWQAYQDPFIDGDGHEFVVVEPFVVTPYWVKDRRMRTRKGRDDKQMLPHILPHDTTFDNVYRWPHFNILVLKYVEGQECFTCTLATGFRRECECDSPFLICSIQKHDIAATDGDGGALIPLDSFKYRLTGDDGGGSLLIQNMFVMSFDSSLRTKRLKSSS